MNTCPSNPKKTQESKAENNEVCSVTVPRCVVSSLTPLFSSQLGGRYADNHAPLSFSPSPQWWSLSEEAHLQDQRRFPALRLRRCTAFGVTGRMRRRSEEEDCNKVWERWSGRREEDERYLKGEEIGRGYRWWLLAEAKIKVGGKVGLKIYTKGKKWCFACGDALQLNIFDKGGKILEIYLSVSLRGTHSLNQQNSCSNKPHPVQTT